MELVRQLGIATKITFPMVDADGDVVTGIAGTMDEFIESWSDGSAASDFSTTCNNQAVEVDAGLGIYSLALDAAEIDDNYIYIYIKDTGGSAKAQHILIRTMIGDPNLLATTTSGAFITLTSNGVDVRTWKGEVIPAPAATGVPDVNLTHVADSAVDTTAAQLGVNVVGISGDTTAADNLESYCDGTDRIGVDVQELGSAGDTTAASNLEAMYDGTGYAGGGENLQVDVVEVSGDSTAADDLELFVEALGTDDKVLISTDAQDLSGSLDVNTKTITANAITATAINADAITAAKIADDAIAAEHIATGAISADSLAADTITAASIATDALAADGLAADALAEIKTQCDTALSDVNLDHLLKTAVANNADMTTEVADGTVLSNIMTKGSDTSDFTVAADSLEAIRDRGDASWSAAATIGDFTTVTPMIPSSIDLADTATVRLAIGVTNPLDDLPTTAEMTPGTLTIDRKAYGQTSWTNVVSAGACSEAAGIVYYDEVFDSGTGYTAGDSIRLTFKSIKVTIGGNDQEVCGTDGLMFQTVIRRDPVTLGSGAITFTYTTYEANGSTPLADVNVWVSTDSGGSNVVASGTSDANGQIIFYLDAGTYYFFNQKSGWVFSNPDTEVVST